MRPVGNVDSPRNQRSTGAAHPRHSLRLAGLLGGTLLVAILAGVVLADHYGVSTDEHSNIAVGRDAIRSFRDPLAYEDYLRYGNRIAHHGPSYFMAYYLGAGAFSDLFPSWHPAAGRHLTNYLTYLFGLGAFYALARRLLNDRVALFATVFFGTQPLLFGHAFINQKDTPFLTFFTASVAAGMWAVDRIAQARSAHKAQEPATPLRDNQLSRGSWRWIPAIVVGGLSLVVLADVLFFERGLGAARQLVSMAHAGQAWPPLNSLYFAVAEDAAKTSVSIYLDKVTLAYWVSRPGLIGGAIVGLLLCAIWIYPEFVRARWTALRGAVLPTTLAAGLLGVTVSIRPIGVFAGTLVALYWYLRGRLRSPELAIAYGLLSAAVAYLTWPFLWEAPLIRFVESLAFTGGFDKISEYFGVIYRASQLPWHYFPAFVLITLTEPFVPLFLLGCLKIGISRRARSHWPELVVLGLWAAVPLFGLIVLHMGIYGNIRHLHFVLVPLFLLAGLGIDWVFRRLHQGWTRAALAVLILAPAIIGIVQLHPLESSYYNSFIGGAAGAADGFTLDRWCVSYREAMGYVNTHARGHTVVAALYSPWSAQPFAAPDVFVGDWFDRPPEEAEYLLACSFFLGNLRGNPEWDLVHTVTRAGAVFAEVFHRVPFTGGEPESPYGDALLKTTDERSATPDSPAP